MILHHCPKNYDHMIFGCRVMALTKRLVMLGQFFYFTLWDIWKLKFSKNIKSGLEMIICLVYGYDKHTSYLWPIFAIFDNFFYFKYSRLFWSERLLSLTK